MFEAQEEKGSVNVQSFSKAEWLKAACLPALKYRTTLNRWLSAF